MAVPKLDATVVSRRALTLPQSIPLENTIQHRVQAAQMPLHKKCQEVSTKSDGSGSHPNLVVDLRISLSKFYMIWSWVRPL